MCQLDNCGNSHKQVAQKLLSKARSQIKWIEVWCMLNAQHPQEFRWKCFRHLFIYEIVAKPRLSRMT